MTTKRKRISLFSLLVIVVLSITIGYAAINSIVLNITGKLDAEAPKEIFITNVEYVSDVSAQKENSEIQNYIGKTVQSKIALSTTNANSEIIYKVSIYNNTKESGIFLDAIYDKDNYDNENIIYEILNTGFKPNDEIKPKETKEIYIKFKYKDATIASNNVLNSYIKFSIGKPNMLSTTSNTGDYFGAISRTSIEKISFRLGNNINGAVSTFDASDAKDNSIIGYVTDSDSNGLYEITFLSDDIIYTNTNSSYLFYGLTKLTDISFENFKTDQTENIKYLFYNCSSLTSLDLSKFNTAKVTTMEHVFYGCSKLTSLDLSSFDTTKVTAMNSMFYKCSSLTSLNISSFDTSKVVTMSNMFQNCSSLTSLDLNNFNTSNVTDMKYIFYGCGKLAELNVTTFETINVKTTSSMFYNCRSLTSLDLSSFKTENVTNMVNMFYGCNSLTSLDLSSFETSKVINMKSMFNGCKKLTELDLSTFDTTSVTTMANMFDNCIFLTNLNLNNFYTINVNDMSYMFDNCANLKKLTLENFDTSNVNDMSYMFENCNKLTVLDLGSFNTSNVTSTEGMFISCSGLRTIYASNNFNTDAVEEDMSYEMFYDCTSLVGGNGTVYNSKYTDKEYARIDTDSTPGYFTKPKEKKFLKVKSDSSSFWGVVLSDQIKKVVFEDTMKNAPSTATDVSELEDRSIVAWSEYANGDRSIHIASNDYIYANPDSSKLFYRLGAELAETVYIDNLNLLNTSEVTNMMGMFGECYTLTNIDLSSFTTSKVTDMNSMFYYCGVKNLDLSTFDTSKVTNMSGMFEKCSGIENIDLTNLDTSKVTNMSEMFRESNISSEINLSNFDTSNVTDMSSMFYNCNGLTSLNVGGFDTSKVTNMSLMFNNCTNLTTIYVNKDKFITDAVTNSRNMFYNSTKLVGGNGTGYSASFVDKTYARLDTSATPGYFTDVRNKKILKVCPQSSFWGIAPKSEISYINFKDTKKNAPSDAVDVSASGDGSIVAWLNATTLNVVSDNYIYANADSSYLFNECVNLIELDLSNFNTSNVINMSNMFNTCGLTELDLSSFNTGKVTNMSCMFAWCTELTNLNITSFDTSKVTNMESMFSECSNLTSLDLSNLNTSKVTDMSFMFEGCNNLAELNLTGMNTAKVTNMSSMFYDCSNLTSLDLSSFDTSKVISTEGMFNGCSKVKTIYANKEKFVTNTITSSNDMFYDCTFLVGENGTKFNLSYTDKTYARVDANGTPGYFTSGKEAKVLKVCPQDTFWKIGSKKKSTITSISFEKTKENAPTTATDVSDLGDGSIVAWLDGTSLHVASDDYIYANPDSSKLFYSCYVLTELNLDNFNTSNVTNMNYMFGDCYELENVDLRNFDTSNVTNMGSMFYRCKVLTSLNVGSFDTSNVTSMSSMFRLCNSLIALDLSNFNTSNVINMSSMFDSCGVNNIDVSSFNTSSVTNMSSMFDSCSNLINLNISNFNTINVTNMSNMFNKCSNLTNIDLSSLDTSNVTNMSSMFYNDSNLKTIYVSSKFVTDGVTSKTSEKMFYSCTSLVGGNGTKYNSSYVDKTYARIDTADTPGYFTLKE